MHGHYTISTGRLQRPGHLGLALASRPSDPIRDKSSMPSWAQVSLIYIYSKFPVLRDQEVWPKTLVSYRIRGLARAQACAA